MQKETFQTFSNIFKPWCFNLFKVVSTCGFHRCPAVQVAEQQKELADDAAQKLQNLQEELNGKDEELQTVSWLSLVMQWCFEPFERFSNFSDIFRLGLRVDAFCHSFYDVLSVSTMIWCINRADTAQFFKPSKIWWDVHLVHLEVSTSLEELQKQRKDNELYQDILAVPGGSWRFLAKLGGFSSLACIISISFRVKNSGYDMVSCAKKENMIQ